MQAANHNAGTKARTTRDASLPQESSESAACEDCHVREAAGVDPAGRALCRPCARRFQCLVPDGGQVVEDSEADDSDEAIPLPARAYESREYRRLKPGTVHTDEDVFNIDHVETLSASVRCVNYDDGDLDEVVEFPWRRIEAIEWHPAEDAREGSPYDPSNPFDRRGDQEAE